MSAEILPFRLTPERTQELILEADELLKRRREILRILGIVALEDKEDPW